jgi:Na+-translocating ferredoxin:NAD+ oxidoreductase RnfA subunit
MSILTMFLMVLAAVLFFVVAVFVIEPHRHRLIAAGLFCWVLAELVARVPLH